MLKANRFISSLLAGMMCLSVTTISVHAEENDDDYFIADITYPNEESAIRYDSRDYSYKSPVNLTNRDSDDGNAKIKLIRAYRDGEQLNLKKYSFSYDYIDDTKHVETLKAAGKTLKLPIRFLKASAYTKNSPIAHLTLRKKNQLPTDRADDSYTLPFLDSKYNKAIGETLNFAYLKNGRYGTSKNGISLGKSQIKVNGRSIKKLHYSWWTNEYSYINKKWRATSYILCLNYPFTYDEDETYSAYQFTIKRNKKGYIQSLKLANVLTYNSAKDSEEVWEKGSLDNLDETSEEYAGKWKIGQTFKYKYVLNKVKLKKVKATREGIDVTWKTNDDNDGYIIEYALKKNFKNKITYKINGHTNNGANLGNVESQKKYYIRIRSFGTVDEKTYYSKYSAIKSATTY